MIFITEIRTDIGPDENERVVGVRWIDPDTRKRGENSAAEMVGAIEIGKVVARISSALGIEDVGVTGSRSLRSYKDGKWSDGLLRLPRY
jgi:hypothetical protein